MSNARSMPGWVMLKLPFDRYITVLVLTRGFKRASPSGIKGLGDLGFKERVMLDG